MKRGGLLSASPRVHPWFWWDFVALRAPTALGGGPAPTQKAPTRFARSGFFVDPLTNKFDESQQKNPIHFVDRAFCMGAEGVVTHTSICFTRVSAVLML